MGVGEMSFLHTEQYCFNILMNEEKNNAACPPVMRFILSDGGESIRKNCPTDGFISYKGLGQNMGNSNNGNKRFVNAAYRYIQVNGQSSTHEIVAYVNNTLARHVSTEICQASSLLTEKKKYSIVH